MFFEKTPGLIYLDTSNPEECFDEADLQLLTGIAGIAAVAFENAGHFHLLEDDKKWLQNEVRIEHEMVRESEPMRAVYQFIGKVVQWIRHC